MKRRVLSVWFPRLPTERALRRRPCEGPFALVARLGQAEHLHCLNMAASAAGLARGMALADARALCPGLVTRPADLVAEAGALMALARWAGRYSPLVARDGLDGLLLDLAGVAHLFGGEAALLDDLRARLARAGITARTGLADTRGAAHALARHGAGDRPAAGIAPPGAQAQAIGHLPASALRLDEATAQALHRLGLRRIADLAALPRAALGRRFGPALLLRLEQALGSMAEPLSPESPPPVLAVRLTLPEPIGLTCDVMAGLARLLERLCDSLRAHGLGARRLRLELRRVDGGTAQAEIGLARPMQDAPRMAALFARAVASIDAGFGIDALRLTAPLTQPLRPRQITTLHESGADDLADLVTRLGNRLGFDNLLRAVPADSHIPEKTFQLVPIAWSDPAPGDWPSGALAGPPRPLVLFPPEPVSARGPRPPARFRWRGMRLSTARATGPERIAPEWWLDDPAWRGGLRDYWRVQTHAGRRLWLFHTPQDPGWFVHGEFA